MYFLAELYIFISSFDCLHITKYSSTLYNIGMDECTFENYDLHFHFQRSHRKKITGIRRRIGVSEIPCLRGRGLSVYSVTEVAANRLSPVWDHYNEYGTTVCTVAYAVVTPSLLHTEPVCYRLRRNARALVLIHFLISYFPFLVSSFLVLLLPSFPLVRGGVWGRD